MTRYNLKNYLLELTLSFLSTVSRGRLFSRRQSAWPTDSLRGPKDPKRFGNNPPSGGL